MPINELEDFNKYYTIQIWSATNPSGDRLENIVREVSKELIEKNKVNIIDVEGPTSFLPDFFSELCGKYQGYLILLERDINPYDLKRTCMTLETNELGERQYDIDIYISKDESIHRRDLENIKQ